MISIATLIPTSMMKYHYIQYINKVIYLFIYDVNNNNNAYTIHIRICFCELIDTLVPR